jgi:hypothetical protein
MALYSTVAVMSDGWNQSEIPNPWTLQFSGLTKKRCERKEVTPLDDNVFLSRRWLRIKLPKTLARIGDSQKEVCGARGEFPRSKV